MIERNPRSRTGYGMMRGASIGNDHMTPANAQVVRLVQHQRGGFSKALAFATATFPVLIAAHLHALSGQ